jgi:hypothetical protein
MIDMRSPIYTLEEIDRLPEFGADYGWFYGLVRNPETRRVWIYEILPGMGYCCAIDKYYLKRPKLWWWTIEDIYRATKRNDGKKK